jgi:hypothetical protein
VRAGSNQEAELPYKIAAFSQKWGDRFQAASFSNIWKVSRNNCKKKSSRKSASVMPYLLQPAEH